MRGEKETEVIRGAIVDDGFDCYFDGFIDLFRFMEEINGYDFVLVALFDHEPMKRFECRSDVRMLRSVHDSMSYRLEVCMIP